jgi:serine/threonine-protein kinase Stk1
MPFLARGTCIDHRFQIQAKLGRGGICEVYLARLLAENASDGPPQQLALKCLKPKFYSHATLFSALIWENELLQNLRHPHIVRSQGFYVSQLPTREEFAFIAMEYVPGQGVDKLLKQHHSIGFPLDLVRVFIHQLGSALQYLHQQRLVHGDLKPSNLLVYDECQLKLIDFGLACLLEKGLDSTISKSRIDFRAGLTPVYVSPERLSGKPLTIQDDIFSLGCVIYELIAGHRPWKNLNAEQALQRQLPIAKLAMLNRREWAALSHALALNAAERATSVDELMTAFL